MDEQYVRNQFPITTKIIKGDLRTPDRNLIYFDHAASTHAPISVLNAYVDFHKQSYANIHRGEHTLSQLSSEYYDQVEHKIGSFLGLKSIRNEGIQGIITTNTTSSLDLASHVMADEKGIVVSTELEHHSNILPHRRRGKVKLANLVEDGTLNYDNLEELLQKNDVKLVAVSAGSNVSGYMPNLNKIARLAHENNAKVLVDAAQRIAHKSLEMKESNHPEHLDFIAGAGHKFYAPFGAAFLMGSIDTFDNAPPYIPAGGTVAFVTTETELYLNGPNRHTPGTPNIAGAYTLGKALEFLTQVGMDEIRDHEIKLLKRMFKGLGEIDNVTIYGDIPIEEKLGVVSFNIDGLDHDITANMLDKIGGIAVRNGCFCAHPYLLNLMRIEENKVETYRDALRNGQSVKLPGAVRASIGIYNTVDEVEKFISVVEEIAKVQPNEVVDYKATAVKCGIY